MARWVLTLAAIGLLTSIGCEQPSPYGMTEKVTPEKVKKVTIKKVTVEKIATENVTAEDVHRDTGQTVGTLAEYSRQTKEESPKNLETQPADGTPEKVATEAIHVDVHQAVQEESEYSLKVKKELQKKLENQLNELDAKIAQLRDKGRNLEKQAKADWETKMAELDVKMDGARNELNKLGHSSVDAWNEAQSAAESAYKDMETAVRDASK